MPLFFQLSLSQHCAPLSLSLLLLFESEPLAAPRGTSLQLLPLQYHGEIYFTFRKVALRRFLRVTASLRTVRRIFLLCLKKGT